MRGLVTISATTAAVVVCLFFHVTTEAARLSRRRLVKGSARSLQTTSTEETLVAVGVVGEEGVKGTKDSVTDDVTTPEEDQAPAASPVSTDVVAEEEFTEVPPAEVAVVVEEQPPAGEDETLAEVGEVPAQEQPPSEEPPAQDTEVPEVPEEQTTEEDTLDLTGMFIPDIDDDEISFSLFFSLRDFPGSLSIPESFSFPGPESMSMSFPSLTTSMSFPASTSMSFPASMSISFTDSISKSPSFPTKKGRRLRGIEKQAVHSPNNYVNHIKHNESTKISSNASISEKSAIERASINEKSAIERAAAAARQRKRNLRRYSSEDAIVPFPRIGAFDRQKFYFGR